MKKLILLCGLIALAACALQPSSNGTGNTTCKDASGDCNPTYDDGTAK